MFRIKRGAQADSSAIERSKRAYLKSTVILLFNNDTIDIFEMNKITERA